MESEPPLELASLFFGAYVPQLVALSHHKFWGEIRFPCQNRLENNKSSTLIPTSLLEDLGAVSIGGLRKHLGARQGRGQR